MLVEVPDIVQRPDGFNRRWFANVYFDLTVWIDLQGRPIGFQLIYNAGPKAHVLTLQPDVRNLNHERYDDGESRPGKPKYAPIISRATQKIPGDIIERFIEASRDLEHEIVEFVKAGLKRGNAGNA